MNGKLAVVTGANGGIGYEVALGLAKAGMKLVCVTRSQERGEAAVTKLKSESGNDQIELMLCDLESQASIRQFSEEFHRRFKKLDVLVNNAGVINATRHSSPEGYEGTFALNHLGYFLLTGLLLDLLKAGAPSRVVNVASEASRMGRVDFDDLMGERKYSSWRAYGQSKLANIMFTYDLAQRLEGSGVTVNAIHPGGVATGFGSSFSGILGAAMKLARPFMRTPRKGAETAVYLATAKDLEGISGKYWSDLKPIRSIRSSYDAGIRQRLWQTSEKLTGFSY